MKKIEIKVDEESLELYNKLDGEEKKRFEESVLQLLASFNRDEIDRDDILRSQIAQKTDLDYIDILKKFRKNAESKGFTDEILGQILNEE